MTTWDFTEESESGILESTEDLEQRNEQMNSDDNDDEEADYCVDSFVNSGSANVEISEVMAGFDVSDEVREKLESVTGGEISPTPEQNSIREYRQSLEARLLGEDVEWSEEAAEIHDERRGGQERVVANAVIKIPFTVELSETTDPDEVKEILDDGRVDTPDFIAQLISLARQLDGSTELEIDGTIELDEIVRRIQNEELDEEEMEQVTEEVQDEVEEIGHNLFIDND